MFDPMNLFAKLPPLPKPSEVLDVLLTAPTVLSDQALMSAHMSHRSAQMLALAVRQIARDGSAENAWVAESVAPFVGKIIDIVVPVMGQNHTLRWQVDAVDILQAQYIEPVAVEETAHQAQNPHAYSANVTLIVMPSVYDDLWAEWPPQIQTVMHHVHISGESALADWVSRLLKNIRPDVWAQLAKIIGVAPASWVQQGVTQAQHRAKKTLAQLQNRFLSDGLSDNSTIDRTVALRRIALTCMSDQIHQTREAVDVLGQRIQRLQQKMQSRSNSKAHS